MDTLYTEIVFPTTCMHIKQQDSFLCTSITSPVFFFWSTILEIKFISYKIQSFKGHGL